jgi:hypothetical protein
LLPDPALRQSPEFADRSFEASKWTSVHRHGVPRRIVAVLDQGCRFALLSGRLIAMNAAAAAARPVQQRGLGRVALARCLAEQQSRHSARATSAVVRPPQVEADLAELHRLAPDRATVLSPTDSTHAPMLAVLPPVRVSWVSRVSARDARAASEELASFVPARSGAWPSENAKPSPGSSRERALDASRRRSHQGRGRCMFVAVAGQCRPHRLGPRRMVVEVELLADRPGPSHHLSGRGWRARGQLWRPSGSCGRRAWPTGTDRRFDRHLVPEPGAAPGIPAQQQVKHRTTVATLARSRAAPAASPRRRRTAAGSPGSRGSGTRPGGCRSAPVWPRAPAPS